jgi:hypothetical protein
VNRGPARSGRAAPFRQVNSVRSEGKANEHDNHANDCYRSDRIPSYRDKIDAPEQPMERTCARLGLDHSIFEAM